MHKCIEKGEAYDDEFGITDATGRRKWVRAIGVPIRDSEGKVTKLRGVFQDISERKERTLEFEKNHEFTPQTIETLPLIFYAKDLDRRFLMINEAFRKFFNWSDDDVVGKLHEEIFPPDLAKQFRENDLRIIESKQIDQSEEIAISAAGNTHHFQSFKFLYIDRQGKVYGTGGISLIISEKREYERQAHQAAKLASIGELAAGVGHEINNPITIIKGLLVKLQRTLTKENSQNEADKVIQQIDGTADRIASIVAGLRKFSRLEDDTKRGFDMKQATAESVQLMHELLHSENVQLSFTAAEGVFPLVGFSACWLSRQDTTGIDQPDQQRQRRN